MEPHSAPHEKFCESGLGRVPASKLTDGRDGCREGLGAARPPFDRLEAEALLFGLPPVFCAEWPLDEPTELSGRASDSGVACVGVELTGEVVLESRLDDPDERPPWLGRRANEMR